MKRLAPSADTSAYQGGVWPTEPQKLLLRAALLDAPAALPAWEAWLARVRTDALDDASWRMIPLLYANLKRLGVQHPLLAQARECHAHAWRSNQKLFFHTAGFLEELGRLNIPALVLKGVALANLYYPDSGARPMADLDVLVPAADFLRLGNHMAAQGWKETDNHSFAHFKMDTLPSFGFMRDDGFWVDIHYHVLHANCTRGADDGFWADAQAWTLRGKNTLALAPEDQLLHVISHGVRWCDLPPFRWIADAWLIHERRRGGFDWERVLKQARFHEVSLPLLRGLEFMREALHFDVPADVLRRLEAIPVSAKARVRFIAETHPLPTTFFLRAVAIWKAIGEDHARCGIRAGIALVLYAFNAAARERTQILAESQAWARRLFGAKRPH